MLTRWQLACIIRSLQTQRNEKMNEQNLIHYLLISVTIVICTLSICLTYHTTHTFYKTISNTEILPRQ